MYGNQIGDMAWMDLSTQNAEQVKDFYQKVLHWQCEKVAMQDSGEAYSDFAMSSSAQESSEGSFATGICHARGANKDMPAVWLPYFLVVDIELAVKAVNEEGGELVTSIKSMGDDKYVVIKDPAGAQCALYQKGK